VTNDRQDVVLAEELRQFAAAWDYNLREQALLEAARRFRSDALI
jgi:hypothetical protein